jgi:hypothetical protein
MSGEPFRLEGALFDVHADEVKSEINMLGADVICGFFG